MSASHRIPALSLALLVLVGAWSAIAPHDRFTWILETAPVWVAGGLLLVTYRRFRFTDLAYVLMLLHAIILLVGGKYTYAEVPLGNWLRDALELSRNHYDRLGHVAQGLVPALVVREVLLRTSPLRPGKWLFAVVVAFSLAISAAYELLEWAVAAATGAAAEAFLALQGDEWDTQTDMLLALLGAIAGLVLLGRRHDRELTRLGAMRPSRAATAGES
jgi:putative membrane protein